MAKARAYGADARLLIAEETTYGVAPPAGNYYAVDFRSADLSSNIPLGDDPLLGRGRNAQDPYRGLVTDEGNIEVPIDLRGIGLWLRGLFGAPTTTAVPATGYFGFNGQPTAGNTITVNGVVFTFVTASPTGNEILIGATVDETVTNTATALNASADPAVSAATYTADTSDDRVYIDYDTPGPTGNSFTLASGDPNIEVSAPNLKYGGYRHDFLSGASELPSLTIEVGHPLLATPVYFRHVGCVLDTFAFAVGEEGPANATIGVVAQGEDKYATTIDPAPSSFELRRFSQTFGWVLVDGNQVGTITGGRLEYGNGVERVRSIRPDGRIAGADPTLASANGQITVRFDGATLVDEAANGTPVGLTYGLDMLPEGYGLVFDLPRVFLPKPKYSIGGPGGVEAAFDWRAAYDSTAGYMLKVSLLNDVPSY